MVTGTDIAAAEVAVALAVTRLASTTSAGGATTIAIICEGSSVFVI
jgi:hypothetical protein